MWFAWLLIIAAAVVWWMIYGSREHCPSCGIELQNDFGAPWKKAAHCRCGWRRNEVL